VHPDDVVLAIGTSSGIDDSKTLDCNGVTDQTSITAGITDSTRHRWEAVQRQRDAAMQAAHRQREAEIQAAKDAERALRAVQTITITSPSQGSSFTSGESVNLRWTHTGSIDSVKGWLMGQGVTQGIGTKPCSSGQLSFRVPNGLPQGVYKIELESTTSSSISSVLRLNIVV
jgi:hypothetical protein